MIEWYLPGIHGRCRGNDVNMRSRRAAGDNNLVPVEESCLN